MNLDPYALPETTKVEVKDPKDFLRAVYLDVNLPLSVRMRAAIELMPYVHPKLAVTAVIREQDFATLLDQRIAMTLPPRIDPG